MELDVLRQGVDEHLKEAQEYLAVRLDELPESNLFRRLTCPGDYNTVDVEFDRTRVLNARQINITVLSKALNRKSRIAAMKQALPKQCFRNAWLCSLNFGWNYCEGIFIDAELGGLFDHAWNKTSDGYYVDITGEGQPIWHKDGKRLAECGVYVLFYEIPPARLLELVRKYRDECIQWQLMSKIDWFTKHAPDQLEKGPVVIRMT